MPINDFHKNFCDQCMRAGKENPAMVNCGVVANFVCETLLNGERLISPGAAPSVDFAILGFAIP